jgi:hypothetical protein
LFSRESLSVPANARLLGGVIRLHDVNRMSEAEEIYQSSGKSDLGLSPTMIHDFRFRDWCVLFGILSNPVEDLLFTIVVDGGMLSSLPELARPMRQGCLHRGS